MVFMLIEIVPFSFDCCCAPSPMPHTCTLVPRGWLDTSCVRSLALLPPFDLVGARANIAIFIYVWMNGWRSYFTTPSTFIGYWMRLNVLSCAVKMDFNYRFFFWVVVCVSRAPYISHWKWESMRDTYTQTWQNHQSIFYEPPDLAKSFIFCSDLMKLIRHRWMNVYNFRTHSVSIYLMASHTHTHRKKIAERKRIKIHSNEIHAVYCWCNNAQVQPTRLTFSK